MKFIFAVTALLVSLSSHAQSPNLNQGSRMVTGAPVYVEIDEEVDEITAVASNVEIRGTVGELTVIGGVLTLRSTAYIRGDVNVIGSQVTIEPGAQWEGEWVEVAGPFDEETWETFGAQVYDAADFPFAEDGWGWYFLKGIKLIFLAGFAFLAWYVAPFFCQRSFATLTDSLFFSGVWGVLSALVVLPLTIFLALSVVGIPLLPLQYSLLFLFFLTGHVLVATSLSKKLMDLGPWPRIENKWFLALLGLILLELALLIPYAGAWIYWFFILAGFGASSRQFYSQILRPNKTSGA